MRTKVSGVALSCLLSVACFNGGPTYLPESLPEDAASAAADARADAAARPADVSADGSASGADAGADAPSAVDSAAAVDTAPATPRDAGDPFPGDRPAPSPLPYLATVESPGASAGAMVTLTVTGLGFAGDARIFFDGQAATTTRTSETALGATIAARAVPTPGLYAVWVENGAGNARARTNQLYLKVPGDANDPEVVDLNPDNAEVADTITIVGRNLSTLPLTIKDKAGATAARTETGFVADWLGANQLETAKFVVPRGWASGPVTVSHSDGAFHGKILTVASNLTRLPGKVVTVSSEWGGSFVKEAGTDNRLDTGWFAAMHDCVSAVACTSVPWYTVSFAQPQTIGRLVLHGNRKFAANYDYRGGRFEILGANNSVLWWTSSALPGPDRDLDLVLTKPVANARAVRFTAEQDDGNGNGPGFSELAAFAR